MQILSVLADPVIPVFAIMAFGYCLGFFGKTTVEDARLINRFAMSVLLPIMLFGLSANAPIHDFNVTAILVYFSCEVVVFALGFLLANKVLGRGPGESLLLSFAVIFVNNALVGLPISIFLYGAENSLPVTSVVTLDSTVAFTGVIVAIQMIKLGRVSVSNVATTIFTTPMIYGIVFGFLFAYLHIDLPAALQTFVTFNGAAGPPVALFALGVVLSQTKFDADPTVLVFSVLKLLLFPFLVWAGLAFFSPDDASNGRFLLASAGPAGAMSFSLALLYGVRTDAITQVIVWTSLISVLSLAALA